MLDQIPTMIGQTMNATEERTSGEFGTVEFHSRTKTAKPYRSSCSPRRIGETAITAQGAMPSTEARKRKARIEAQQAKPERKPRRKVRTANVRYVGYSRTTELIGIEVKVRGLKADTYWLPYHEARKMWDEFSNEPFPTLI